MTLCSEILLKNPKTLDTHINYKTILFKIISLDRFTVYKKILLIKLNEIPEIRKKSLWHMA